MFTSVSEQSYPVNLSWKDWAIIGIGLVIGVGIGLETLLFISRWNDNCHSRSKRLKKVVTWKTFWLLLSGVIHIWIEGSMVFARSTSHIKQQIDVYAAADYRYGDYGGHMESGTAAMECITALIVGPLCFLVLVTNVLDHPLCYVLQLITCTMQLYGLTWFTLQPLFTTSGLSGHFSSDPILFWIVAVGCNAPWAIFPTILLFEAIIKLTLSMSISISSIDSKSQ